MAEESISKMSRSITMGQAIGFAITIFSFMGTFYVTTQTRLTALEIKMENGEVDRGRFENKIDKLNQKVDDGNEKMSEIKIILTTKQDKK